MKKEELEKMLQDNKERRNQLAEEYDVLLKEMEKVGAGEQSYSKDSTIEIPGPLFSSFVNFVSHNKRALSEINNSLTMFINQINSAIELSLTDNDALTVAILEQHIEQVKKGATVSNKVIEQENAEVKIGEIEEA